MTNLPWTRGEVGIRKCDIDCGEQELRSESKIFAECFVEENGFGVEGCKYYARVRTLPRRDGLGNPSLEAKEIFNSLKPSNMYILIIDGLIRSHLYNNIMILCIDEQALWRRLQKTYSMLVNTVENDGLTESCDVELCELTKIVCFMTRFGRVETFLMK